MAKIKLREFLQSVNLFPKNFASNGAVNTPTMTRVVTKAAMAVTLAPWRRKDPARGKAMNAWIRTTDPNKAARMTPLSPESWPMTLEMRSGGRRLRRKPIDQMVKRTRRAMEQKNFQATRRDLAVFSLSLDKETQRRAPARSQMIRTNMDSAPDLISLTTLL
jgi:hypothetical protein